MITVKTYRGHIRNWKELCEELAVDAALPREEKEQEILVKAYQKCRPYLWYVCFCPVG